MSETVFRLKVTHDKPLPDNAGTVIENRFYLWAHSQGVAVDVVAEVEPETQGEAKAAA